MFKKYWYLEDSAEGALSDVPDVDDVVARVLEQLQLGVERGARGVVVGVLGQLSQVDLPVLDLGHHVPACADTAGGRSDLKDVDLY